MTRTKGAIGKKPNLIAELAEQTEPPKKKRGRQKGEKVETLSAILNINKNYRVKMSDSNYTLQEKGEEETDTFIDDPDSKDVGWKFVGHFWANETGLMEIAKRIRTRLILKKAAEKKIVSWEEQIQIIKDSTQEIVKMFAPLGMKITTNDKTKEIVKKYKKDTEDNGDDE